MKRVEGEVVVVADADSWTDGVTEALDALLAGAPWAVPHRKVYRLSPEATADVLAGRVEMNQDLPLCHHLYIGRAGGGVAVVRKEALLEVPFDPRFVSWGGEDVAWARALKTIIGQPWRGRKPLYHLFHPPERLGMVNQALADRYEAAVGDPAATRALIAEAQ